MLNDLSAKIDLCLIADRFHLQKSLANLRRIDSTTEKFKQAQHSLDTKIAASIERVNNRRAKCPPIKYVESLPVAARKDEIAKLIQANQVIVLAGETGSGKTTQIPKICLELGLGAKGLIGHTQPRRIAARSVATRIAEELGQELGDSIGYQVRFTDKSSPHSLVKLMTDGILLAEIQRDRYLNKYEVIIIDEAHERSLNIDFLLGYLRQLLPKRPDLKLIITSATIDVEKFSQHFSNAPIVSVEGRTFPVEIVYRPTLDSDDENSGVDSLSESVLSCLREIEKQERNSGKNRNGDVLVFLSGEREIRDLAAELRKLSLQDVEVLPLYARLTPAEQQKIFKPHRGRRIVLATNVAETSLTVPGIVYVIDTGFARVSRYSVQSKVQRLPIEPISQASANQRAGRCGRVAEGICYRLYSFEDFTGRPEFTDPEIQRTNLSAVILQMLLLGLGDIENFPFVESPDTKSINDGFRLLSELGAISDDRKITRIGQQMARLPADPRLARMLLESNLRGCLDEMLVIVSALSVQDPKESPPDKRQAAQQAHREFAHPDSDFVSWINLWSHFEEQRQALSQGALRKYCQRNFLSFLRMREWRETHRQLHLACAELDLKHKTSAAGKVEWDEVNYESVHRSIIRGSLNLIGSKTEEGLYLGSRNKRFSIFPTSTVYKRKPKWVVTGSLIETSRLFATLLAKIEPQWAVESAGNLVKRDYSNAHWEKKRGNVVAYERVTLFGLCLVEKQKINYGRIDPVLSREIFIREGIVGQELETRAEFYAHNIQLISDLQKEEDKLRRPDILVSEEQLVQYYASRIPVDICDLKSLERWLKVSKQKDPNFLQMTHTDVLQGNTAAASEFDFPSKTEFQDNALSIDYTFEPGSKDDGAAIEIPLSLLSQMDAIHVDWAIPGQIRERCIHLLKGLPKSVRKHFIPVPDFVDEFVQWETYKQALSLQARSLNDVLSAYAQSRKNIEIDSKLLESISLPLHVYPQLRIIDDKGVEIARGHDLKRLQEKFTVPSAKLAKKLPKHPLEVDALKDWSFETLPEEVVIEGEFKILRYPALFDIDGTVSIRLCDNRNSAIAATRHGLIRLYILRTTQQKAVILKQLKSLEKQLLLKAQSSGIDFGHDCLESIYAMAFDVHRQTIPRSKAAFESELQKGRAQLVKQGERFCRLVAQVIESSFQIRLGLAKLGAQYSRSRADMESQMAGLIFPRYLLKTPPHWLMEYPRFFKALELRMEKLTSAVAKDEQSIQVLGGFSGLLTQYEQAGEELSEDLSELRWSLEELRVSLFAQTLKTKMPISEKRLQKRWQDYLKAN